MMERLGRYEIVEELGRGAMGTVYRARDPKIDRVVALKTITVAAGSAAEEEEYRQRFLREAQAAGKLSHPNLVVIHDVGEEEASKTPYIVMEFIEGITLENLGRGERLPTPQALELVKQVAEALDYAHGRGIVHRDIKPANVLVTEEGRAKITDFGIAKVARAMTQVTQAGQVLGTPAYMAPEQLSGGAVDGRADLFSLGVILYWLLTGEKPFTGDTTTAVSFKIVYQDPIPATRLNPALPSECDYVLQRALAKDPSLRYQRGRELGDDLEDLLHGKPPRSKAAAGAATAAAVERTIVAQPRPAEPPRESTLKSPVSVPAAEAPLAPKKKRRRLGQAVAAVLALLLLGGLGWWWASGPEEGTGKEIQQAGTASPAGGGAATKGDAGGGSSTPPSPPASGSGQGQAQKSEPPPAKEEEEKEDGPPPWAAAPARRSTPEAEPRRRTVPQATLRLTGEHSFARATIYVYADGQLLRQFQTESKRAGRSPIVLEAGEISASVPVTPGEHTVSIRVKAPGDNFDQIEYIDGRFTAGRSRTLEITFGKLGRWIGVGELTRELKLHWLD